MPTVKTFEIKQTWKKLKKYISQEFPCRELKYRAGIVIMNEHSRNL